MVFRDFEVSTPVKKFCNKYFHHYLTTDITYGMQFLPIHIISEMIIMVCHLTFFKSLRLNLQSLLHDLSNRCLDKSRDNMAIIGFRWIISANLSSSLHAIFIPKLHTYTYILNRACVLMYVP